jgi:uncharacterized protein YcfJ
MKADDPVHRTAWISGLAAVGAYGGLVLGVGGTDNGHNGVVAALTIGCAVAGGFVGKMIAERRTSPPVLIYRSDAPNCSTLPSLR